MSFYLLTFLDALFINVCIFNALQRHCYAKDHGTELSRTLLISLFILCMSALSHSPCLCVWCNTVVRLWVYLSRNVNYDRDYLLRNDAVIAFEIPISENTDRKNCDTEKEGKKHITRCDSLTY